MKITKVHTLKKEKKIKKKKYEISYENIKMWYDGYKLTNDKEGNTYEIYAPYSIINAIDNKKIENFWCRSETYLLFSNYINMNYFKLKELIVLLMKNQRIKINISKFQNDMVTFNNEDDILTMIVHLGYLA